jgi:hypothetical protein
MKSIIKHRVKAVEAEETETETEQTEARPKDVTYIEGFNPMFENWEQEQIEIAYAMLTGESTEEVDEDALTELVDKFTTELELRTNLKEWRLWKKTFPEGERYLLQELRTDTSRPYYLTQRVFIGKQKALKALHNVRDTGELE